MEKNKSIVLILSWGAIFLWMSLIFYLSHQPAAQSDQLSIGITELILQKIRKILPIIELDIEVFNHIVRKNAHFFAYLILGVLVINGLNRSGMSGHKQIMLSTIICILYAISDEVHQSFVPGRGPGVMDVLIDSAGAIVGIWMYRAVGRIKKKVISY